MNSSYSSYSDLLSFPVLVGHGDFGGEVERMLSMVDGVVLLVDATEVIINTMITTTIIIITTDR